MTNARLLVVDDDRALLDSVVFILKREGYEVSTARSGREALERLKDGHYETVISDIKMPGMSGLELIDAIRSAGFETQVILMTAYAEVRTTIEAIRKNAFDFIIKPCEPQDLIVAVGKAVRFNQLLSIEKDYKTNLEATVEKRTKELSDALGMVSDLNDELLRRLTTAAECRDTDTGSHLIRIGLYSKRISEALGMSGDFIGDIMFTSTLHDIGKIGISDNILLKPAALTKEEFEIMKTHTTIGSGILRDSPIARLTMAEMVALRHHERWDGTGYPDGLADEQIPLPARIVIICDQYDALMMRRPYKAPLGHAKTYEIITIGDGRTIPQHFDPEILEAFKKVAPDFEAIFNSCQD
ncbi:response regulator [Candidatus Magnetominusculus dajiuhuensis]|uniref:response regulator n=1 Tax=Candidatus Magnetominusculus dajiuhuensis TaxID=3137712 RepID=UPI003B4392ED